VPEKEAKMPSLKKLSLTIAGSALLATGAVAAVQHYPMVGGAAMYPTKNIIENAVNSKDHTTLVAAVKAAGLVGTRGPAPSPCSRRPTPPLPSFPQAPSTSW
jgi:uncharacterized surface protein with fasciclin (FAS1) repeats